MWLPLNSPLLARSMSQNGEGFLSFARLIEQLSKRTYADQIYAFISHASFILTTAPTYQEADGHDWVSVVRKEEGKLFSIAYEAWVSDSCYPNRTISDMQSCEWANALDRIDCLVLRMINLRRSREGL